MAAREAAAQARRKGAKPAPPRGPEIREIREIRGQITSAARGARAKPHPCISLEIHQPQKANES